MTDFTAARTAMVDCQVRPSDVTKYPIIDALLATPREAYVPDALREVAYVGEHVNLGNGRVVLEARTFAKMLDAVNVQKNEAVLDLGCGMGYSTAILARMADAVIAIEDNGTLAAAASEALTANDVDNAFVVNAPLTEGAAKHGPFDVLIIEGAVESIPDALLAQVKTGGRIAAIFADGPIGQCRIGIKSETGTSWRYAFDATAPILAGFEKTVEFQFS
jgi:protein-L-isoaspartate(D-aspartate) O-methyltransferase